MSNVTRGKKFIKRPDDAPVKKEIENLKSDIKNLDSTAAEINALLDRLKLDSATVEKRKALQGEMKEIIAKQSAFKTERSAIQSQIKNVEEQMKRKIAEIQRLTGKTSFRSVAEIDARVKSLEDLIGSGDLKLAEERRYVKEMTSLRKLRKDFAEVDAQQSSIDNDKKKITELKEQVGKIGNREIQSRFETIQKELDEINTSSKSIYDQRSQLMDKRSELRKLKDSKYDQIRKLKSDFDVEFAKFKEQLSEEKKKRDAEWKAKQEEEKQIKRKEEAQKKLEEASVPAFASEINEIHGLLSYFDPSYKKPQKSILANVTNLSFDAKTNIRKVEMPEDVVVLKKEQQSFYEGSATKKSKKKNTRSKNFTVEPDVIVSLSNLAIPLPVKLEDVVKTIETLKSTLRALEEKQDEQTQKNIEKAKEEIAKLNEEANVEGA